MSLVFSAVLTLKVAGQNERIDQLLYSAKGGDIDICPEAIWPEKLMALLPAMTISKKAVCIKMLLKEIREKNIELVDFKYQKAPYQAVTKDTVDNSDWVSKYIEKQRGLN